MKPEAFPVIKLVEPVKALSRAVTWFFTAHQLASHGEHFVEDTLATPIRPVTALPSGETVDQAQRMEDYWRGWQDREKPLDTDY